MENLIDVSNGYVEFPTFNSHLKGVKENRYSYMLEFMTQSVCNKDYKWPILKYDHMKKQIVSKWAPSMTCAQEPSFVANPNEPDNEEAGLLLVMGYCFDTDISSLFVIDPLTMTQLQEYRLPFRLPMGFHSEFYEKDKVKPVTAW